MSSGPAGSSGSMSGMAMGGSSSNSGTGSSSSASSAAGGTQTTSTVCSNVKGATTMANGMVMAPVPSGAPTAAQQAAADQLVAETQAPLAKYANLSTATAAGYTPATNPNGYLVHYANWQIVKTGRLRPVEPGLLDVRQHGQRARSWGPCTSGRPLHTGAGRRWAAHPVARSRRPLPRARPGRGEDLGVGHVCCRCAQHEHLLHAPRLDRARRSPPPISSSPT